ncbi:zinc-dependent metalloprotease [Pedobacter endophyticus]|uniref:Zinc-dependent metalloprotease n=1 Tax=Pedobacter endophyticus TaxID=2789740 RepID=A0A7U3Q5E6_9SPHI|nr:zinc-dependent metalloprotease [Pedobacter endophyticus]QPH38000.1 zinc-dependent metalloprotease [Pedobacter endophyticus]
MKKNFKVLALAGIVACGMAGSGSALAQKKSKTKKGETTPAAAPAAPKKEGIKPYSEVITSKARTTNGLFKTHKVDDKWYFEIPDSLINREMLAVTRLSKVPVGVKVGNQQYGGEQINEQVWKWERRGKQVYVRVPSYATKADPNSDMFESVQNSNLSQILASFEIKAYNKDTSGVVIDVTDFYNGDVIAIGATDQLRKAYKVTAYDMARSYIDTVKTFPVNIEVRTTKTYRAAESPTDNSNGAVTFEFNTSMLLLPKIPVKARIMDKRVGFFGQSQIDYGSGAQKAERTAYIHRWNLVPKDTNAYKRGELVEPIKPIVIYIDPATPNKWVPYLIQGINDWQVAFEAAGFKNAIIGKKAPTPQEDPEFSVEDSRYSVVRYFASDIANAYGPHISDPRTGQILETHIGWYHNVMNLLRNWYFVQTAAINPSIRKAKFSDAQMGELIRFVSSHEIGHTLGLPHNFGSSYAYPVDSLRSKTFTDAHGTAPSIMDYARFNYIAQPGDGVTKLHPQIGEYDKWAVKWGYSWLPGGKTAEQEKEILDQWTLKNAGNPLYFYGRQGTMLDPRLQNEDLGDNAMKASGYGIANLKRILPNIEKWTYEKGEDYSNLKEIYGEIVGQFNRYMGHVTTNVGGLSENFKTYEQSGPVYAYLPQAKQKEAIGFLNQQLFTTPLWLINNEQLSKFDNGVLLSRIKGVQTNTLGNLLSAPRLARLLDNETKNGTAKAYTLPEMFTDLRSSVFVAARPDAFKRNLQRAYVDRLSDLMTKESELPAGFPVESAASYGLTPINVGLSDIRPLVRVELKKLLAITKARAATGDEVSKAHYDDLNIRIKDILDPKK